MNIFFEIELLKRVELTGASCHDMTVSRDSVGHVEVVYVLGKGGAVKIGFSIWLVSKLPEA